MDHFGTTILGGSINVGIKRPRHWFHLSLTFYAPIDLAYKALHIAVSMFMHIKQNYTSEKWLLSKKQKFLFLRNLFFLLVLYRCNMNRAIPKRVQL